MKKINYCFALIALGISFQSMAQCGASRSCLLKNGGEHSKSSLTKTSKWTAFVEPAFQAGICGPGNKLGVVTGIEKSVSKNLFLSGDIHFWKSRYDNSEDGLRDIGKFYEVIPSVKLRFDPGVEYKGLFGGVGIGYAFMHDRGTEQVYSLEPNSGVKTMTGTVNNRNWDQTGLSLSYQGGVGFKLFKLPMAIVNNTYFIFGSDGLEPISVGLGLKMGFQKLSAKSTQHKKPCCSRMMWRPCSH